jgi:hypothetical protein
MARTKITNWVAPPAPKGRKTRRGSSRPLKKGLVWL